MTIDPRLVGAVAAQAEADPSLVLGRAIAHELGHLLIGTTRHSTHGLMRALVANKLRGVLTMLGVIIGVAAVITLMSIGRGAQQQITEQVQSLGTNLIFVSPGAQRQQSNVRTAAGNRDPMANESNVTIMRLNARSIRSRARR